MDLLQNIFDFIEKFNIPGAIGISALSAMIPGMPMLPAATINYKNFKIMGVIATYIGYVLGSLVVFNIVLKLSNRFKTIGNFFDNHKSTMKLKKIALKDNPIFILLALIIPVTPTSLVIYVCAISNMEKGKFIKLILIAGVFSSVVSSAVGVKLISFIENPVHGIIFGVVMIIIYILSKIVGNKYLGSIKEES